MKAQCLSFAVLWLLQLVSAAATEDHIVLEPVPRYLWDRSVLEKRDEATEAANVTLTDFEEMIWTTPPNHSHPTTVSMVVFTKGAGQDRLIIDMGKFAFQLKKANCKKEDMSVQFKHKVSFDAAKKSWDWVNYNGMRSFVLIADHFLCGKDWSLEPWLVSTVTFNETALTVKMDAEKKTWKQITQSYAMDFGQRSVQQNQKRFIDFNFDESFTLDLSSDWPEAIITEKWEFAEFGVTCRDCGTKGSLVFAGHIEGSVFGGIDKFMISATPHGIEANLNLEASFGGSYDFGDSAKKEFDIVTIPLPAGWTIPGILTFGPNAKVTAGFALESISGQATVSTGVTASIPEDSIAKVDLFAEKALDIHGWIPEFETQPLEIKAEVSANAEVYTKLAVAVSLEVLDENGVNVDINLKFPKFKITASGGWNPEGFCPNDPNPFGVSLDIWLGAELALEGWTELDGKREELFDVDLFVSDELFHFPLLCKSFGDAPAGSCAVVIEPEDREWWENEVNDPEIALKRRTLPATPTKDISRRRPVLEKREDRTYHLECDTGKAHPIKLKGYLGPTEIKRRGNAPTPVPIMYPKLDCGDDDATQCTPDFWEVIDTPNTGLVGKTTWAAEHVYEGSWIKEFLDVLYTRYYANQEGGCKALADAFQIGQTTGTMADLLDQIGTTTSHTQTMTIFKQTENSLKHRLFDAGTTNIDVPLVQSNKAGVKSCRFGRVVNSCKYMMMDRTQVQLMHTLTGFTVNNVPFPGIDGVLSAMTATPPSGMSSWQAEHKAWFKKMYADGVAKARKTLVDSANTMKGMSDFASLPADTQTKLNAISNGGSDVDPWCADTLNWP